MHRFSIPRLLSSTNNLRHFSTHSIERLRNIWISGLIDPAKATVSERYMLYTGQMKRMNEARIKNERRDRDIQFMMEEGRRLREMSIMETLAPDKTYDVSADITFFNWKNHKMSVIDTTDFVEFTDDFEGALPAFDSIIQVLCSVDGVQSQSINVDMNMLRYGFPRLVFINNIDQKGANPWKVLSQARSKLQHHSAAIQVPIGLEDDFKGLVDLVQLKAYYFHGSNGEKIVVEEVPADMDTLVLEKRRELIKTVSEVDDKLAEAFCNDRPISAADLQMKNYADKPKICRKHMADGVMAYGGSMADKEAVHRATVELNFIPVFMGSAFKYKGLQLLWDGVLNYLPCPCDPESKSVTKDELEALTFTLNRKYGPITYLRIYEGVIRKGDYITNRATGKTFKVPSSIEIRKDEMEVPHSYEERHDDFGVSHSIWVRDEAIHEAHAGEIVALHDVYSASGDTFTDGLVRYTKASIDVSELVSKDSEVQVSKVLKDFPCQA